MTPTGANLQLGNATFGVDSSLIAYLTGMSRFGAGWLSDALDQALDDGAPTIHHRRREIVFAANAAESYLLEWVAQQYWLQNQDYVQVSFALNRHFPKPPTSKNEKALSRVQRLLEAALEKGDDPQAALSAITETQRLVAEVQSRPQPSVLDNWRDKPGTVANELLLPFRSMPTEMMQNFETLVQLRNQVVHAGLSWPRGFRPGIDGLVEPKVTVERIQALPNAFASFTVMDMIHDLHNSTATEMIPAMKFVADRFKSGVCPIP